jgi:hypothetical protein
MHHRHWIVALSLLNAFAVIGSPASAVTVNWSALTWTNPGSLSGNPTISNSYDVDAGNAGNDVTVAISGNTSQFQPSLDSAAGNPQTPQITRAFDGGLSTSPKTLELALDLSNNTQSVTVTVTFASNYTLGVNNISFKLFDIDSSTGSGTSGSNYQDLVKSITATSILGTTISPTITADGPNVTLGGTGNNQTLTGNLSTADTSGAANATISFSSAVGIRSFTFTYGDTTAFADPTYQHIGIYNIDYSVVPEINPTWFSLLSCGLLVGWNLRKTLMASRPQRARGFLKRGPRFGSATTG